MPTLDKTVRRICVKVDGMLRQVASARLTNDGTVILVLQKMDKVGESLILPWSGGIQPKGVAGERRFSLHPSRDKPGTHITSTKVADGKRVTTKLICKDDLPSVKALVATCLLPEQSSRYALKDGQDELFILTSYRSSDAVTIIISIVVAGAGQWLAPCRGRCLRSMDIGDFRIGFYVSLLDFPSSRHGGSITLATFAPQIDGVSAWNAQVESSSSILPDYLPETLLEYAELMAAEYVEVLCKHGEADPVVKTIPLWFHPDRGDLLNGRMKRRFQRFATHLNYGVRARSNVNFVSGPRHPMPDQ